jgi:hypothetical protein
MYFKTLFLIFPGGGSFETNFQMLEKFRKTIFCGRKEN